MKLKFREFTNEIDDLVKLMISNTWKYHATTNAKEERIRAAHEKGYYIADGCETFWIEKEKEKIGLLRIYDLDDGTPLFDIRFSNQNSGRGLGTESIKWMTDYIFNNYKEINRIEGNTRQDNYAMRKVFIKCGFVKESHYRKAWESRNGDIYDAIGYGIIRDDWEKKIVTPVNWNDIE